MTTMPPEANDEQGPGGDQTPPEAPQTPPAAPQYSQPEQPQYQAPPAGAYQQPPGYAPPGYQQPQAGYAQPVATDPANTITLNYWLSVFFTWIPALIFYVMEKDKGDQRAMQFHIANLNFALLRTAVGLVWGFLWAFLIFIPIIGWIISALLGLASLGLFIVHLLAAVTATDDYRNGRAPKFPFNMPLIK